MTIVRWGESYSEFADLSAPQLAALRAVRAAAAKTSGDCFVSKKTETSFDHKTTINAIAARTLEKVGLIATHVRWHGAWFTTKANLTDRGVLALRDLEAPTRRAG